MLFVMFLNDLNDRLFTPYLIWNYSVSHTLNI